MFEDSLLESGGKIKTKSKYWMIATFAFNGNDNRTPPDQLVFQVSLDGSANVDGDKTVLSITADADRGKGDVEVSATAEAIEWSPTVDIVADGVTIELSQAA